jgi:ATP diphosphatase
VWNVPAEGSYVLSDLLRVMARLRDPEHGCPWDLAQDFDTIVPSTLEEAYELVAAIEHADFPHLQEELGDLLFQVIFYARLGEERTLFDFHGIVDTLVKKLIRRHPHVFADGKLEGVVESEASVDTVRQSWEKIKREERLARQQASILADIPTALPALSRAQKLQKRAAGVGFDWPDITGVLDKLDEEVGEFVSAGEEGLLRQEEELGDILFTCVNLARHTGVDAESALRRAASRFESRFNDMEQWADKSQRSLADMSEVELDSLWNRAKGQA